MALFGTLNTGASGLTATSTAMSVIGDNIANINTTGFKGSRADFASMIPNSIGGLGGAQQLGTGTGLSQVRAMFGQGSLQQTGSALDMAVTGNGFFQVNDGDQSYYTRDGSFYMDNAGYVTNAAGLRVQGYSALDDGTIIPRGGDLQIDTGQAPSQATSEVTFDLTLKNLDTSDFDTQLSSGGLTLDGNTVTLADVDDANGNIWATSSTIYDDAGNAHEVTFLFEQESDTTVTYKAVVDGAEMGQTEGFLYEIGEGSVTLTDGAVSASEFQITASDTFAYTTSAPEFSVLLGKDVNGDDTDGGVLIADENSVTSLSQDGYAIGEVTGIEVDDEGIITANYTNGEEKVLGQVVLATFDSQAGLRRLGGNLFSSSYASGDPAIGTPGSGTRGNLQGFALEGSNVELEHEFVKMIQSQRSYQANARVISTASDTLQELVNLL